MGMFDKDKVFAPDGPLKDWAGVDSEFILWDCWIQAEVFQTSIGEACMSHLEVSVEDSPDNRHVVSAIGNTIGDKVRALADGDLPAVVRTREVPASNKDFGDAYVINFVSYYDEKTGKRTGDANPHEKAITK